MIVSIVTGAAIPPIIWCGGVSLAISANMLGYLEIGERIFRFIPDVNNLKSDLSLAATWDSDATNPSINSLIGKVYGIQSLQMAKRYHLLGERWRCRGVLKFEKGQIADNEFSMAELWFTKSASIYRQYEPSADLADTLSNIAYSLVKQGKYNESRASLAETNRAIAAYGDQGSYAGTHSRISLVEHYLENSALGTGLSKN